MPARQKSRQRALQILYLLDMRPEGDVTITQAIHTFFQSLGVEEDEPRLGEDPFAEQLARGATEHRAEIDQIISAHSVHWRMERMAVVDRNILRVATFEMMYLPTPAPVTLANTSLIGQPAPNFSLNRVDGTAMRLSSYRGRVVFVNFWATWCEPCQRELPAFQSFMAEQGPRGALVLAVNSGETAEQVSGYFAQHQITAVPALLDTDLQVYDDYNIQLLPTTYVIDAAGVVRYLHLGEMTTDDLNSYVAALTGG